MKTLVLRSKEQERPGEAGTGYVQERDTAFARRVLGNLAGGPDFCAACGPECVACRAPYGRRFSSSIAGAIDFPAALPYLLESPQDHVPDRAPPHDILLAICIQEQILLEMLKACPRWGAKGVVVPLESPAWVSGATRKRAFEICAAANVEIAFPRPFCSFDPPQSGILAEFRQHFHIGLPEIDYTVEDGRIAAAEVRVSAPCGADYYIARGLVGRRVDDDLEHEVIAKRLSGFPCTASMEWDDELGDTPMHESDRIHYQIVAPLGRRGARTQGKRTIRTPAGVAIPEPVSYQEGVGNVERAKAAIVARIEESGAASLAELKRDVRMAPAALQSALLILKQEGKVRVAGQTVSLA